MTLVASPIHALVALRQAGALTDLDARGRIERWALGILHADPVAGGTVIRDYWEGALDAGATETTPVWSLLQEDQTGPAVFDAVEALLAARPAMADGPLQLMLVAAARSLSRAHLAVLATAALARKDLSPRGRTLWEVLRFAIEGEAARDALDGHAPADLRAILDHHFGTGLPDSLPVESEAERASRAAAIIRTLGPGSTPEEAGPAKGRVMRPVRASDTVLQALQAIQRCPDPAAAVFIQECLDDPSLAAWYPRLHHAKAAQAVVLTDETYHAPTLDAVLSLLAGGPPVNACDLRAIIVDELERLARSLVQDAEMPWQDYWNTNKQGPTAPKSENEARNTTLTKLKAALNRYKIVVLPEVQRKHGTRVDIYVATALGCNLPIEAKRHYHKDLWTAAATQLQGYTSSEGATGVGILLVFWFGADWAATPTRSDKAKPQTVESLKELLVSDLSEDLRRRTDVIILNVSRPGGGESYLAYKKRTKPSEETAEATTAGDAAEVAATTEAAAADAKPVGRARKGGSNTKNAEQ
jgi:hypothetical protein